MLILLTVTGQSVTDEPRTVTGEPRTMTAQPRPMTGEPRPVKADSLLQSFELTHNIYIRIKKGKTKKLYKLYIEPYTNPTFL